MTISKVPTRLVDVTHEIVDTGESVLYDESGKRLLVLNPVGAHVWSLMNSERSISELALITQGSFGDVEYARLLRDVEAFVEELAAHGVARLDDGE